MEKIFAVILTYNRKDLLKRCLAAVQAQSRRCDGVIVIDNASSDGTEEMLLKERIPNLKVYILSENIGASGGFSAGFRIAYQSGADYVWMMDDDVIPQPDALQRLIEADETLAQAGEPRAFLLSTAYTETGLLTNVPIVDQRCNRIDYQNWPRLLEHGMVPVRRGTFVSILMPRATIERYGLPIASMFIWGEDAEYTLRITEDAPGYLVGDSKVQHLRQLSGAISITRESNPTRLGYHHHYVRNEVYVARKFHRKRRLLRLVVSQLALTTKLLRGGQFHKALIVTKGLLESISFVPKPEAADAPIEALGVTVRSLGAAKPIASQDCSIGGIKPAFTTAQ